MRTFIFFKSPAASDNGPEGYGQQAGTVQSQPKHYADIATQSCSRCSSIVRSLRPNRAVVSVQSCGRFSPIVQSLQYIVNQTLAKSSFLIFPTNSFISTGRSIHKPAANYCTFKKVSYLCEVLFCKPPFLRFQMKRESGESPGQSRCCKLHKKGCPSIL